MTLCYLKTKLTFFIDTFQGGGGRLVLFWVHCTLRRKNKSLPLCKYWASGSRNFLNREVVFPTDFLKVALCTVVMATCVTPNSLDI